MKKFATLFAFLMFLSIMISAQPQLTWRFANAEVVNAGTQFQFDVEVMADAAGTFQRDLQIYFDYNTSAFGSDIVSNGYISVSNLTLMENYYSIVNMADNTSSKFAVITEADNEMDQSGSASYFNEMTTSYQGLLRITIDISDNTALAGIVFDEALMNGGQYYQSAAPDILPVKYTDPCLYNNDLSAFLLSSVYGNITYANGASTPLSDVTVTLMDGVTPVTSDVSDASGDYNLSSMNDGSYTLESSTTKAWGGLSMNDVQFARQYVTNQPPGNGLTGLQLQAGDVIIDGNLFMNDVLAMWQEATANPPGFTHFWIFEVPGVTVTGGLGTQSFQGICAGDTDASYAPPSK